MLTLAVFQLHCGMIDDLHIHKLILKLYIFFIRVIFLMIGKLVPILVRTMKRTKNLSNIFLQHADI